MDCIQQTVRFPFDIPSKPLQKGYPPTKNLTGTRSLQKENGPNQDPPNVRLHAYEWEGLLKTKILPNDRPPPCATRHPPQECQPGEGARAHPSTALGYAVFLEEPASLCLWSLPTQRLKWPVQHVLGALHPLPRLLGS